MGHLATNFRASLHGLCILAFIVFCFNQPTNRLGLDSESVEITKPTNCSGLNQHQGYETECEFLKANPQCNSGVTLLPLGNGAPDVFACIAAFVGTDNADVGLNSISGGAVFVICVVVGTISLCVADHGVSIDRNCFVRDVCTFLFAVVSLAGILFMGEVNIGGAIAFVSIYVVYATFVAASEIFRKKDGGLKEYAPLLPLAKSPENRSFQSMNMLLTETDDVPHLVESKVPHWMWGSNVAIYSEVLCHGMDDSPKPLWGWIDEETQTANSNSRCSKLFTWLEFPLMLTRRLTIPIIDEERWSKRYAVASVSLAPLLVAFLWNSQDEGGWFGEDMIYICSAVFGGVFGIAAFVCTRAEHPPQKLLFPWVMGGFFMSIIWFYMVANELVALLVAIGLIFNVNPSILGLTVLAWGNSMGDLMSNVVIAMNVEDGVQIAICGCYAGPMFNTLVGLGISMLIGSWSKRPDPYTMSRDSGLFCNLGFIVIGLVWALVVLPRNRMQPNKLLGMGLIGIYLVFLSLRIGMAVMIELEA